MHLLMQERFTHVYKHALHVLLTYYVQATTLDPKYAKAWSRLATARSVCLLRTMRKSLLTHTSLGTFYVLFVYRRVERGLKMSPSRRHMSEEDKRLKVQFEQGLAKAIAAKAKPERAPMRAFGPNDKMPWTVAAGMVARLRKNKVLSSVCDLVAF
jgi:hypothetical protein